MAIKELFYDQRPIALLDPRASQRIDPRFTFARNGTATYRDKFGYVRTAAANTPRIDYDPATAEPIGLLLEKSTTNILRYSQALDNASAWEARESTVSQDSTVSPSSQSDAYKITLDSSPVGRYKGLLHGVSTPTAGYYTFSCFLKAGTQSVITISESFSFGGSIIIDLSAKQVTGSGGYVVAQGIEEYRNGWFRVYVVFDSPVAAYTLWDIYLGYLGGAPGTPGAFCYAWGPQLEANYAPTSYIPTAAAAVTRSADLLYVDSLAIPRSGSIYIDARALRTTNNSTLLSLKNASNQKINLAMEQRSETYNSLALINTYSGTAKSSLPLPVPTTNRERNIITWGANNYQYTKDSSRFAPSLSTSVPANLTSLSIGHDSVDPTKAFNGYINSVYLYSGEIAPAVAEALVRGELNPVNADTYSPSGPAGSLALVINTQGASASGDKVFALPAESAANDNDLVITWGDGTESALELAAAEVGAAGLSHTYPSAGIYPVWVEGKMQNLYFNNSASAPDLLRIASWGTGQIFTSPSTMNSAFFGCLRLKSVPASGLPNTGAVIDWSSAFRDCRDLSVFPQFDTSSGVNFSNTWFECNSLLAFPNITTSLGQYFNGAWYNCNSMTSFYPIDLSSALNLSNAWFGCANLEEFPQVNTSSCANFSGAWALCSGLRAFPLLNTSSGVNFDSAWLGCTSINNIGVVPGATTSFPQINTSSAISLFNAWSGCSSITVFPNLNTSLVQVFAEAWFNCTGMTVFPELPTGAGTNFFGSWRNCTSLSEFPSIDTSSGTNFQNTWFSCSGLLSFPVLNTASGTDFENAWRSCTSLNNIGVVPGATTSFPLINTSNALKLKSAWHSCSSLTVFPPIVTSAVTDFESAWLGCSSLISFPTIDTSNALTLVAAWLGCVELNNLGVVPGATASFPGISTASCRNFALAWAGCSSMTSFPSLNYQSAIGSALTDPSSVYTGFRATWQNCSSLSDFPANQFNTTTCTRYLEAFENCALTASSIENILVSINAAGTSNGNLGISGGTNAAKTTWSSAANTAYNALVARGWTITFNA